MLAIQADSYKAEKSWSSRAGTRRRGARTRARGGCGGREIWRGTLVHVHLSARGS